jgi:iron complex transport system substrate-binding protein
MEDAKAKHPRLSMEEVTLRDPEVIILGGMTEKDSNRQKQWWGRWQGISAVRNRCLFVADADLTLRPSPRIVEGLEQVARAIHPEAFPTGQSEISNKTLASIMDNH